MKKYGFRTAVFVLSFAIGIGFVWLLNFFDFSLRNFINNETTAENDSVIVKKQSDDIEIKFKKYVETEFGLIAYFEITNYGKETYVYYAFPHLKKDDLEFTLTDLKLDGKKIDQWKCGTGLSQFELKPGESKTFQFNTGELSYSREKRKVFEVGFEFKKYSAESFQTYWSEKLPTGGEMLKRILRERKKFK